MGRAIAASRKRRNCSALVRSQSLISAKITVGYARRIIAPGPLTLASANGLGMEDEAEQDPARSMARVHPRPRRTRYQGRVAAAHCCAAAQNRACHSSRHTAQASGDDLGPVAPYAVLIDWWTASSVLFTSRASNVSLGSSEDRPSSSWLTRLTSAARFHGRARARYPAGYTGSIRLEDRHHAAAFPLPFGHRHSLLGRPVPATESSSPHGRPAGSTQWRHRALTGFPRFARTRFDRGGRPLYPGTVVLSRLVDVLQPAPATFSSGQPYTPLNHPISPGVDDNGTSLRVHVLHPSGLPLACGPRMGRGPLGFTLGFRPRGCPRRPPGRGRASSTGSELHLRHPPTPNRCVHLRCATSCRTRRSSSLRCGRSTLTPPARWK